MKKQIQLVSIDGCGIVSFVIDRTKYTYSIDAAIFHRSRENFKFQPWKLFNVVKTRGILTKKEGI